MAEFTDQSDDTVVNKSPQKKSTTIPKYIGKYKITSLLAKGGMGEVYKAIHPTLSREVILKKLTLKDDDQFIQRFNREARIMMDFKNDNIVDVYDHFKEGQSYYIVLEYVDGIALDGYMKENGVISNQLALYIVLEIAKALKYAHDKGVVHRDIKPGNILLSKKGDIKLVDFGIAVSEEDSDEDLTSVGVTLGTPSYMAPEQFENSKNVDKRADIYSLGVMLYELVTGQKPFPSGLTPQCINLIQKGKYRKAKDINENVNTHVTKLIKKLMHHKLSKRAQDLEITINRLNRYLKKQKGIVFKQWMADSVIGDVTKVITLNKSKKVIYIPIIITLLLTLVTLYFVQKDLHYKIFKPGSYGVIKLTLKVNDSYYKEVDEIYIKSKLFLENGIELDFVENSNYEFIVDEEKQEGFSLYKTKEIYLPKGFYRLKVMVDGNLFWKNFNVIPLKMNKNAQVITLQHKEPKQLPFYPVIKVINQITKVDITDGSTIYIQKNKKFEKFNIEDKTLKTGQIQYFQISKKGFYIKDFLLKISPDQTNLELKVELLPKPGKLIIETNQPGIKMYIDNKISYIKGDEPMELVKLDKIEEKTSIILIKGEYSLQFTYKGNKIEEKVAIESDKTETIYLNYNKENKSFSFVK